MLYSLWLPLLFVLLRIVFKIFRYATRSRGGLLQSFAALHQGSVTPRGFHSQRCILPDGDVQLYRKGHYSFLQIRINGSYPCDFVCKRVARLPYAFMEAFLNPEVQIPSEPYYISTTDPSEWNRLKSAANFSALLHRLGEAGVSVESDKQSLTFTVRVRRRALSVESLSALYLLARDFAKVCAPIADMPLHEVSSESRCAYCKETMEDLSPVTHCLRCGTPHHEDCFRLNGRCAVFGCQSEQIRRPEEVVMNH